MIRGLCVVALCTVACAHARPKDDDDPFDDHPAERPAARKVTPRSDDAVVVRVATPEEIQRAREASAEPEADDEAPRGSPRGTAVTSSAAVAAKWTSRGAGKCPVLPELRLDGSGVCAVGLASHVANVELARRVAEAEARNALDPVIRKAAISSLAAGDRRASAIRANARMPMLDLQTVSEFVGDDNRFVLVRLAPASLDRAVQELVRHAVDQHD
jgi:hypothetical protein